MGFSNAIYKYPKFKDTTLNQIFNMENYFNYDSNEWAKKNFASAAEYMNYNNGYDSTNYVAPTEEQLAFYKQFLHKDEFDYIVLHDYVYDNCSGGIPFHEDIQKVLDINHIENIKLTQKDIIALLNFEIKKLEKYQPEEVCINHSFKYVDSEDNEDDEPTIMLKSCDGVEVIFTDDNCVKRIDTNSKYSDWGTLFMTNKEYIDITEYYNLFDLVKTLSDILSNTNFEKECLVYSGGW